MIGIDGYANGVTQFQGFVDTKIVDSNSSRTLDFSNTVLSGISLIDAAAGNDTIVVSNLSDGIYQGGLGNDRLVLTEPTASPVAILATWTDLGSGDRIDLRLLDTSFTELMGATVGSDAVFGIDGDLRTLRVLDQAFEDLELSLFLF